MVRIDPPDKDVHETGCAAAIGRHVFPTSDNPRVMIHHASCADEVEAYAVNPVEAEGYSVRVLATASAIKLAPGPLPGAGIRGNHHFTIYRGNSGGV
jgi:hypothetical protein